MMKKLKWVVVGILILLPLIVVFQNLDPIDVHLLFATVSMPQAAMLSITLVFGFLLGFFINTLWRVQSWRSKHKKDKNQPTNT